MARKGEGVASIFMHTLRDCHKWPLGPRSLELCNSDMVMSCIKHKQKDSNRAICNKKPWSTFGLELYYLSHASNLPLPEAYEDNFGYKLRFSEVSISQLFHFKWLQLNTVNFYVAVQVFTIGGESIRKLLAQNYMGKSCQMPHLQLSNKYISTSKQRDGYVKRYTQDPDVQWQP